MSVESFDLTGTYCVVRGQPLVFLADFDGQFNITGVHFDSYIVRNFDKQRLATFSHEVLHSGAMVVRYKLSADQTSGIDYAASSWKSFAYESGYDPILIMTGNVNVNI